MKTWPIKEYFRNRKAGKNSDFEWERKKSKCDAFENCENILRSKNDSEKNWDCITHTYGEDKILPLQFVIYMNIDPKHLSR